MSGPGGELSVLALQDLGAGIASSSRSVICRVAASLVSPIALFLKIAGFARLCRCPMALSVDW